MGKQRTYAPDYCNADTMAYMLDMEPALFLSCVSDGILPAHHEMTAEGPIWSRQEVYDAILEKSDRGEVQTKNEIDEIAQNIVGVIYLVTDGAYLKIGRAKNIYNRLLTLQTGSPLKLKILATIPMELTSEKELFSKFAEFRSRGEWFRASEKIIDEFDRLAEMART